MATCRAVILRSIRALRGIAPGDEPTADELAVGMEALQDLILTLHNARGVMCDIDVTADYTPGENQRVRIVLGSVVAITLPEGVQADPCWIDPFDYGFVAPSLTPASGSTGTPDGIQYRPPRDGARIEIVGTVQALYFYRADLNQWKPATGLALDDEMPLNERYTANVALLLADGLLDQWPDIAEPTPNLTRRIAGARAALMMQTGTARSPVMASYF